jgi:hypothetical protein
LMDVKRNYKIVLYRYCEYFSKVGIS